MQEYNPWLSKAAGAGDAHAMHKLALRYVMGKGGFPQNDRRAAKWMQRAADADYAAAQVEYGCMLMEGCGVDKDEALAVDYWQKGADQDDIDAMLYLGNALRVGRGVKMDKVKSRALISAASAQSNADATGLLARLDSELAESNTQGKSPVLRDEDEKKKGDTALARAKALDTDAKAVIDEAVRDLVARLEHDDPADGGKKISFDVDVLEEASRRGHARAMYWFAQFSLRKACSQSLQFGKKTQKFRDVGVAWLLAACEQGHGRAQCHLGTIYADGWASPLLPHDASSRKSVPFPRDVNQAERWLTDGAHQTNDGPSMWCLARLLLQRAISTKSPEDGRKGALWAERAGSFGALDALARAARVHLGGADGAEPVPGVKADYAKAKALAEAALAKGAGPREAALRKIVQDAERGAAELLSVMDEGEEKGCGFSRREQCNADKKYAEAVAVAAEECAEDAKGQACYICMEALHWKTKEGLVRGCSCRGTAGFAHVSCLAELAKLLVEEAKENNLDDKEKTERWRRWHTCCLCEKKYHGVVRCAFGWACWSTYLGRPETDVVRLLAMGQLGNGLNAAGHHEDAGLVLQAERRLKTAHAERAATELLREEDDEAAARAKRAKKRKAKKKRRGAATAYDEVKAEELTAATINEPEAKEDDSLDLERLTLEAGPNDAAPVDAVESPTTAAPETARRHDVARSPPRPVPPAFDSKQHELVAFLATLELQHHAQKLREEQIESVADLLILTGDDLLACGIPLQDVERMAQALTALKKKRARRGGKKVLKKDWRPPPPRARKNPRRRRPPRCRHRRARCSWTRSWTTPRPARPRSRRP